MDPVSRGLPRPEYDTPPSIVARSSIATSSRSSNQNGRNRDKKVKKSPSPDSIYESLYEPPRYNPEATPVDNTHAVSGAPSVGIAGGRNGKIVSIEEGSSISTTDAPDADLVGNEKVSWFVHRPVYWAVGIAAAVILFCGMVVGLYFLAQYYLTAGPPDLETISSTSTPAITTTAHVASIVTFTGGLTIVVEVPENVTFWEYFHKDGGWENQFVEKTTQGFFSNFSVEPSLSNVILHPPIPIPETDEAEASEIDTGRVTFEISFDKSGVNMSENTLNEAVVELIQDAAEHVDGTVNVTGVQVQEAYSSTSAAATTMQMSSSTTAFSESTTVTERSEATSEHATTEAVTGHSITTTTSKAMPTTTENTSSISISASSTFSSTENTTAESFSTGESSTMLTGESTESSDSTTDAELTSGTPEISTIPDNQTVSITITTPSEETTTELVSSGTTVSETPNTTTSAKQNNQEEPTSQIDQMAATVVTTPSVPTTVSNMSETAQSIKSSSIVEAFVENIESQWSKAEGKQVSSALVDEDWSKFEGKQLSSALVEESPEKAAAKTEYATEFETRTMSYTTSAVSVSSTSRITKKLSGTQLLGEMLTDDSGDEIDLD